MRQLSFSLLVLFFVSTGFAQGLYWQSKTTGTVGESTSETFAVPKKMKVVDHGRNGSIIIVRLDKELMWHVEPGKKTYSEITFAQMEDMMKKAGGKMDAAMAQMAEQMKNMPEEQRKMVEKMMGGKMAGMTGMNTGPVEVTRTVEKKNISGFGCSKYVVRQGDQVLSTLWVTKEVTGFAELSEDWKAFAKRMAALGQRFAKGMADAYKDIDGFPIQTEAGGVVTTVTKLDRRSTPAGEFEVPAGYKKVRSELEEAMEKMEDEE